MHGVKPDLCESIGSVTGLLFSVTQLNHHQASFGVEHLKPDHQQARSTRDHEDDSA